MKRTTLLLILFTITLSLSAQSITLLPQVKMSKWGIPAGNYSGITPLGDDRYAIVNDKAPKDGWYEFQIIMEHTKANIISVKLLGTHNNDNPSRDAEGIVYVPESKSIFISAEDDQQIREYYLNGNLTERELAVPEMFGKDKIRGNYGFEALAYSAETGLFWTCTESALKADGEVSSVENPVAVRLRFQSFDGNLQPLQQYLYETDAPEASRPARSFAHGVPSITALDDGRLLVLEREILVAEHGVGSYVINKIYLVQPDAASLLTADADINAATPMQKHLMTEWKTSISANHQNLANYEGMCLGPKLKDGRQTILLIADSQNGYGNALFRLKDYIRVGIIDPVDSEE